MKKAGIFIPLSLLFILAQDSFANQTSIKVDSKGNASATVNVQNSFNSTNQNTNQVESNTKIRIETDGEVKEYESSGNEDIHIESSNGNSSVIIKNNDQNYNSNETVKESRISEDMEIVDEEENNNNLENTEEEDKNFFEKIVGAITSFFSSIFN